MEKNTVPVYVASSSVPPPVIHPQRTEQFPVAPAAPTVTVAFGPERQRITCPHCHTLIFTKVVSKSNSRTHCYAALLCLFCCWPCFCVPYCTDSCQNRNHYCPHCSAYLGAYMS